MARAEREEYFALLRRGVRSVSDVRRLRELRVWKDRQDVPRELRSKPAPEEA
jgi:hypothetical protein